MTSTPQISVVMSVYNAENYLREAIDSILNQTFSDFEFIIIEDCSTDSTMQILEEYQQKDSRIIIIKKTENKGSKGFIENLNLGLDRARGHFIARMDADDIAAPERFEKQISVLEKDPQLFITGAAMDAIDEKGRFLRHLSVFTTDDAIRKNMLKNIALYHPVIMFRNTKMRYREKMISCEDYDFYLRIMLQGKKMANIDAPLLQYRILSTSMSRKDQTFVRWMMVEKARSFYREHPTSGTDSYEAFSPEAILHILDEKYKNTAEELHFALRTAVKFNRKEELPALLKKINSFYPQEKVSKYQWALKMPDFVLKIYSKILL